MLLWFSNPIFYEWWWYTLLIISVCGHLDVIDFLHKEGANFACQDIHKAYPLHYAAQMCGNKDEGADAKLGLAVLHKLIKLGVPVDCEDQDARQPLLWAASSGQCSEIPFMRPTLFHEKNAHCPEVVGLSSGWRFKNGSTVHISPLVIQPIKNEMNWNNGCFFIVKYFLLDFKICRGLFTYESNWI